MPWTRREFKENCREAIRLLRKSGLELIEKREAEIARGDTVAEDILTRVCRYRGEKWLFLSLFSARDLLHFA